MRAEYESIFITLQISSEEILTKKEQLSEALQTMQLFLAKHGDKYVGFHERFYQYRKVVLKTFGKIEDGKFQLRFKKWNSITSLI